MSHEEATHLKYTVKPFHSAGKSPGKYKPGSRCHSKYEFVRQEKIEAVVPQIPRMEPEGKRERCGSLESLEKDTAGNFISLVSRIQQTV